MRKLGTPPKINIEPENDGLEDAFSRGVFSGSMLIFGGVGYINTWKCSGFGSFFLVTIIPEVYIVLTHSDRCVDPDLLVDFLLVDF